jgi:hypothetical protein
MAIIPWGREIKREFFKPQRAPDNWKSNFFYKSYQKTVDVVEAQRTILAYLGLSEKMGLHQTLNLWAPGLWTSQRWELWDIPYMGWVSSNGLVEGLNRTKTDLPWEEILPARLPLDFYCNPSIASSLCHLIKLWSSQASTISQDNSFKKKNFSVYIQVLLILFFCKPMNNISGYYWYLRHSTRGTRCPSSVSLKGVLLD